MHDSLKPRSGRRNEAQRRQFILRVKKMWVRRQIWNETAPAAESMGLSAEVNSRWFGGAAAPVGTLSQVSNVSNVRGVRRQPANSLLLISEWWMSLSTATSLFITKPGTHVWVSAPVRLCRCLQVSKSYIHILCMLCLYDLCEWYKKSRPGQKQWGLTAKMPLKVPLIMKSGWFCISFCSHFRFELQNIYVWMWWQCPWWAA